jgi:hypothetical protein
MSVYVGIDVHRKRSQVAVVDAGGEVLANRNVPNGVKPILSVIGGLPAGTPAAYEAAFGTGWLAGAARGLRLRPAPGAPAAVQGDRLGAAEERQGQSRRDRTYGVPVTADTDQASLGIKQQSYSHPWSQPKLQPVPLATGPAMPEAAICLEPPVLDPC